MDMLEGVNILLRLNGRGTASQLATGGRGDAAEAERLIDDESQRTQSSGWHFNRINDATLSPNASGVIALPAGVITIDSYGPDENRNITHRGGFLYDLDNRTDQFTGTLRVTYLERYDFGCIPHPIQEYIVAKAALTFHEQNGEGNRYGQLNRRVMETRAEALRYDTQTSDLNIIDDTELRRVRGGRPRLTRGITTE